MTQSGSRWAEAWRWFSRPWRSAELLLSLVAAFAVPAVMTSSADLFTVAAGDRVTQRLVEDAGSSIDTVITAEGRLATASVTDLESALSDRVGRIPSLGTPTTTLLTESLGIGEPPDSLGTPSEVVPGTGGRYFVRDGAIDALDVVAAAPSDVDGVWVSERYAERWSLEVGDVVGVEASTGTVAVAGVYRDLWRDGRDPYWDDVPAALVPRFSRVFGAPLFELLVVSEATADALGLFGTARFDVPVRRPPDTLADLEQLAADLRAVERDVTRDDEIRGAVVRFSGIDASTPSLASGVFDVRDQAVERTAELDEPIAATSVAGIALGIVVSAAGAGFVARRRRRELRLLRADGDASWRFFARSLGEFAVPGLLASGVGVLIGWAIIRLTGPTRSADLGDVRLGVAVACGAIGVVGAAATTAIIARSALDDRPPATSRTMLRWLVPTAVLAVAAWIQVGAPDRGSDIDVLVVLFPIVGLAAGVGSVVLLVHWSSRWVRRIGAGAPISLFLAWRRTVASEAGAMAMATVVGTAFGLVVLPALLVDSLDDAARAKAVVVVGGPTKVQLIDRLEDPPAGSTTIDTETTRLSIASRQVLVQAIDPATYADGVTWSRWFGSSPAEVVDLLERSAADVDDDVIPALVVGHREIAAAGAFGSVPTYRYVVVGSLQGAPLAASTSPTIIVSADRLDEVALDRHLAQRPPDVDDAEWLDAFTSPRNGYRRNLVTDVALPDLTARLDVEEVRYRADATLTAELATLDNDAARWSFSYFGILGGIAAAAAAVGLLLYLGEQQARRELGDALTRRMGLSSAVRLRALLIEVAGLVSLAFAAGVVVSFAVARRIFARFEPDPTALPSTALRIEPAIVASIVAAGMAMTIVVVLVVHVRSNRRRLGEILRGS